MNRLGAVLLMVLTVACDRGPTLRAPTAASSTDPAAPIVTAFVLKDAVLLTAQHLDGARQVEGLMQWVPTDLQYDSFAAGQWWFSTPDWEWVMVPDEGQMFWGLWRQDALAGDGTLGSIRFKGSPSLESLSVWVDGRPVEAVMQDQREKPGAGVDGLMPAAGVLQGAQGRVTPHSWFFAVPGRNR